MKSVKKLVTSAQQRTAVCGTVVTQLGFMSQSSKAHICHGGEGRRSAEDAHYLLL